jgi:hypothetical protein
MSDPPSGDSARRGTNGVPDEPSKGAEAASSDEPLEDSPTSDAAAAMGASGVRVVYTDTLPEGVYVVYRGGPPRLLVNEAWWRGARPVERIQALETLWARLQSIPPESWNTLEAE